MAPMDLTEKKNKLAIEKTFTGQYL